MYFEFYIFCSVWVCLPSNYRNCFLLHSIPCCNSNGRSDFFFLVCSFVFLYEQYFLCAISHFLLRPFKILDFKIYQGSSYLQIMFSETWILLTSCRKHEWEKHGTCAATLEVLNSQKKYFGKTLELYQHVNLNGYVSELYGLLLFQIVSKRLKSNFKKLV